MYFFLYLILISDNIIDRDLLNFFLGFFIDHKIVFIIYIKEPIVYLKIHVDNSGCKIRKDWSIIFFNFVLLFKKFKL